MVLLRRVIGDALRSRRQGQHRTLREVSTAANVSLGYLSEIERGQKEASSELLAAICEALGAQLSELLREVSDTVALAEQVDTALVPAADREAAARAAALAGARAADSGAASKQGAKADAMADAKAGSAADARTGAKAGAKADPKATPAREPAKTAPTAHASANAGPRRPAPATPVRRAARPLAEPRRPVGRDAERPTETVRRIATDGTVSVAVHQETPLKATLRATRVRRDTGRDAGRDVVCVV
jgi:transcriptional regulator with XRE-family HTH domain